jgi:hypothetical protein
MAPPFGSTIPVQENSPADARKNDEIANLAVVLLGFKSQTKAGRDSAASSTARSVCTHAITVRLQHDLKPDVSNGVGTREMLIQLGLPRQGSVNLSFSNEDHEAIWVHLPSREAFEAPKRPAFIRSARITTAEFRVRQRKMK